MYLRTIAKRRNAEAARAAVEDDDTSPLLVSRGVPIEDTPDRQLRNYANFYAHYFHQWKHSISDQTKSQMRILLEQLTDMLSAVRAFIIVSLAHSLLAGARTNPRVIPNGSSLARAITLRPVKCSRFCTTVSPSRQPCARRYVSPASGACYHNMELHRLTTVGVYMCVSQASLEILRRQEDMGRDLVAFYRAAMEDRHLDVSACVVFGNLGTVRSIRPLMRNAFAALAAETDDAEGAMDVLHHPRRLLRGLPFVSR